jgi:hypothetical protein
MSAVKEAALRYARAGIAVLPCAGKIAILKHGFHDASTDPELVEAWWTDRPTANVAIHPGSAGMLVIDIDVGGEGDGYDTLNILEREHGELPDTRAAVTPSGGGHLYFRVPRNETFGNAKPGAGGIDIRCSAGYVVAPPSIIGGNAYRWTNDLRAAPLPATWVELLRDRAYVPPSSSGERPDASSCGAVPSGREARAKYLEAAYNDELDQLLRAPEGDGNNQVCRFGFNLGQLISVGMREDNIRAGAEWVFSQWQWQKSRDLVAARRTLESGIRAGEANPREGIA